MSPGLLHTVVSWLYSDLFPLTILRYVSRFEYDDDFEDIPLDMDAEYTDDWLYEHVGEQIIDKIDSCHQFGLEGLPTCTEYTWAHDKDLIARIMTARPGQKHAE